VDGRVLFASGTARHGDIVRARITKTYAFDLVAEIEEVVIPAPSLRRLLLPSLPRAARPVPARPAGSGRARAARAGGA
jgi:hypothetical protein